jgi:hypothetical protein
MNGKSQSWRILSEKWAGALLKLRGAPRTAFINPCQMRFSLAAKPPQQRILALTIETPREEMLTISGAEWLSRRSGACRLNAIY